MKRKLLLFQPENIITHLIFCFNPLKLASLLIDTTIEKQEGIPEDPLRKDDGVPIFSDNAGRLCLPLNGASAAAERRFFPLLSCQRRPASIVVKLRKFSAEVLSWQLFLLKHRDTENAENLV